MKKILCSLIGVALLALSALAQAPQAFKYQAIVRDDIGNPRASQQLSLKVSLTQRDTVYSEVHQTISNAFGLVNLEIGRGKALKGKFDTIHWELPTYIVLALDAKGGSDYLPIGFTELLSVPYALYSATAARSSELPANPRRGDILYFEGTEWKRLPAGPQGAILTMGMDGLPMWNKASSPLDSLLKVTMPNGEVVYVSPVDNSPGLSWYPNGGQDIPNLPNVMDLSVAQKDFNGKGNTAAVVAKLGNNGGALYAAKLCDDLEAFGFKDWYLPAAGEIHQIYLQLGPVGSGKIMEGVYWSSTEYDSHFAWNKFFKNGIQFDDLKISNLKCRCVRK